MVWGNPTTIHERKTIRLKEYDYSSPGGYFITICTQGKICSLGKIVNEEMHLSSIGEIVERCWKDIPGHFPDVELDAYITMPNHVHGIIIINESGRGEVTSPLRKPTLGNMVAYFKYQSTKLTNEMNGNQGDRFWQRNYYEHIIRDDRDWENIRDYIIYNPNKWKIDEENPDHICSSDSQ